MSRPSLLLTVLVVLAVVLMPQTEAVYGEGWEEQHGGSQLWSVDCKGDECTKTLSKLSDVASVLGHSRTGTSILVRRGGADRVHALLQQNGLDHQIMVQDVAKHLKLLDDAEQQRVAVRADTEACTATACPRPLTGRYMTYQQVEWFLSDLAATYPNNVRLSAQGKSTEGRTLWLVQVSTATKKARAEQEASARGGRKQRSVFIIGGTHAREWISPATTLNILKAQVENCNKTVNCDVQYNFMPLINPDGYNFTMTTDRFWRKNRSLPPKGSLCYGTDLNRNWGYKWGGTGASADPCDEVYRGSAAFSTPESSAVRDAVLSIMAKNATELVLFLSYHSYSQLVLYPWGIESSASAPFSKEMKAAGDAYAVAVKAVHGMDYVSQTALNLYPASGTSLDYVKSIGVKYCYTVELRDNGTDGFVLPAVQIKPVFEENWAGFRKLIQMVNK